MFEQFIERENTIFDILKAFKNENLEFVVIGGYAVSAFKHRFSIDADVVIKSEDLKKFEEILIKNDFKKTIDKQLENVYSSKFMRYEKGKELKVYVDLMIDGIASRQTNAVFGYGLVKENSIKKLIKGIEKEITVNIASREFLIALKLNSGRLTDLRDVVALTKNCDFDKIKGLVTKGDKRIVKENIKHLLSLLDKKEFIDSFKGVFIEKKYDIDINSVKKLSKVI